MPMRFRDALIEADPARVIASLPPKVAIHAPHLAIEDPYFVKPGERGYFRFPEYVTTLEEAEVFLDRLGEHGHRRVTPAERQAALMGSMFGWDVPGANPANYIVEDEAVPPTPG